MLVLPSQSRLLGTNPVVWLCDQEPVKTFQKGPPPDKSKTKMIVDIPESVQVDRPSHTRYKERDG